MPRNYWCAIIALVGLIVLTGASPPNEPKINSAAAQNTKPVPTPPAPPAPAAGYAPYPNLQADGCYEAKDHDSADLCAQWRAAIAAEKAANWSWWGNWISAIGAFLSFASVLLVLRAIQQTQEANRISAREYARARVEAKANAKHSERGLEIAASALASDREIGEAQVRAYLTPIEPSIGFDGVVPIFKFKLTNTGSSPAFFIMAECQLRLGIEWPTPDDDQKWKKRLVGTLRQAEVSREIVLRLDASIADFPLPPMGGRSVVVNVYVDVSWIDVFKKKQTLRCRYTIVIDNHLSEDRVVRISETGLSLETS